MRPITELIEQLNNGSLPPAKCPGEPVVAIELIRSPDVGSLDGATEGMLERLTRRLVRLRESLASERDPELLLTYGDLTPTGSGPTDDRAQRLWNRAAERAAPGVQTETLIDPRRSGQPLSAEVLCCTHGRFKLAPAFLALVELGSVSEFGPVRELVETLARACGQAAPVYLVGVLRGSAFGHGDRLELIRSCQSVRMSILVHAGAQQHDLLWLSAAQLDKAGRRPDALTVLACPTFRAGAGMPGITRLRFDLENARTAITFAYDLGSDRSDAPPMQMTRPLISASRVSAEERRLYVKTRELLAAAPEEDAEIASFSEHVERTWQEDGYVALCRPDGNLPQVLEPVRWTRYFLLLLLRKRAGGYDVLLSHHTPLRPPLVGDWDTLLLPAFTSNRALLERLRDDVVRQAFEYANDPERSRHARAFEGAVRTILERQPREATDIWQDQLRELGTKRCRKISPTQGVVTEYSYTLVTLTCLIEREATSETEEHDEESRALKIVREWLAGLRRVSADSDDQTAISLTAIQDDGAGLRWEPSAELPIKHNSAQQQRAEKLPPGVIWFPMGRGAAAPWRTSPSIRARNTDVMGWLDSAAPPKEDRYPDELVLGKLRASSNVYRQCRENRGFGGTLKALENVEYSDDGDLHDQYPYRGLPVERVVLVKRRLRPAEGAPERDAIAVYAAEGSLDEARRRFATPAARLESRGFRGYLRPVQRYTLVAGLTRTRDMREVQAQLDAVDPWGYIGIQKSGGTVVSLTPPIIERMHTEDWDDAGSKDDFVLCDGNHRVVQRVWLDDVPTAAIAVKEPPLHPYYARPFGRFEWEVTAGNRLYVSPQQASKYQVRHPDPKTYPEAAKKPRDDRYRVLFRDLTKGFGSLGGQGGRYNIG